MPPPDQHSQQLPALRPEFELAPPMDNLGAGQNPQLKPQRLLKFLLKFWWIPTLTVILSVGTVGVIAYKLPRTFVSKSRMWETVKLRLPDGVLFTEDSQTFLGTQTELLQSKTLRDMAIERLRTTQTNIFIPRDELGEPLPVNIRIAGGGKSSVFTLEATCSNPPYLKAYLDALMSVYLEYKRNIRKTVSGDTLASITEQVQRADRDLKTEQDTLRAFQLTNNLAILEEEGKIAGGYLARLKTQLSDLQLENRLLQASASAPGTNSMGSTNILAATSLTEASGSKPELNEGMTASKELELLKLQRDKLSKYLRPKHPKIVKLDSDIERSQKLIEIFRRQNREQLEAARQANDLKIENVQGAIKEWEGKVIAANVRIAEAERLRSNVQRAQAIYERLVTLVNNVGISRNIDQETLSILEPATPALRSWRTEKTLGGLSLFGGLALGAGIVFLLAMRDDRLTSFREVNERLGEVIVGQVPEVELQVKGEAPALLELKDPRHAYAESFRSLRSALLFMATDASRPKVILVTSAVPNEGKSTVAANLARAMALGGSRVVLIDADLRKGVLHKLMGLERQPGLPDALKNPANPGPCIQVNSLSNLAILSSGRAASHSGDLLLSPEFDQLIATLRAQYDYVVIDSSPVFASDDATTLAPKVDGTLFVVRSRFSRAGVVREALEQLYQRNARVLGLVLNQADVSDRSYYYYKYADYSAAADAADSP